MERTEMLPAVEDFVARLRAACADGLEGEARWRRCGELLEDLLADPALKAHARGWPVGGFDGRKVDNLLFYVDPDYGFALNGLIKRPGGRAQIHDHGPAWTVYGLLEGRERIARFGVATDADGTRRLEETSSVACGPGDVDIVAPHENPFRICRRSQDRRLHRPQPAHRHVPPDGLRDRRRRRAHPGPQPGALRAALIRGGASFDTRLRRYSG